MSLTLMARYGTVGIITNLLGYGLYLGLTTCGVGYTLAMTLVYIFGVLFGYFFNRNWTFAHKGSVKNTLLKYIGVHAVGYSLNFTLLYALVTHLGLPHQWVQLFAIGIVALTLLTLKTNLVFTSSSSTPASTAPTAPQ